MKVTGQHGDWTPHQWANDWITADGPEGQQNVVLSPLQVQLSPAEQQLFRKDYARYLTQSPEHSSGEFWAEWQLMPSGHFRRRPGDAGARRPLPPPPALPLGSRELELVML